MGVGKYVTPDFYLKYSRDFSVAGEAQINADPRQIPVRARRRARAKGLDGAAVREEARRRVAQPEWRRHERP